MVAHPAEYRWSSYRANGQGEECSILQPHPTYTSFATNKNERLKAYREQFKTEMDPDLVDEIRRATNSNLAPVDHRFVA